MAKRCDVVDYYKEEPLYYAKMKDWEKVSDDNCHYYLSVPDGKDYVFVSNKDDVTGYILQMTKAEWNKLGIDDTNAYFEEGISGGW